MQTKGDYWEIMKKKELEAYFKKLEKLLRRTQPPKQARKIITQLRHSSVHYFQENPNAGFEDFIKEFGDIEELDLALLENAQDLSKLTDTAHFKRKLLILIIAIVLFVKLLDYGLWFASYIEGANTEIIQKKAIIY